MQSDEVQRHDAVKHQIKQDERGIRDRQQNRDLKIRTPLRFGQNRRDKGINKSIQSDHHAVKSDQFHDPLQQTRQAFQRGLHDRIIAEQREKQQTAFHAA